MLNAVREARVHFFTTKMKVRFPGVSHRPTADSVIQVQQAGLVSHFRAGLCGNESARRCRWDRGLLVTWPLAKEAAGANGYDARLLRRRLRAGDRLAGHRCGGCCRAGCSSRRSWGGTRRSGLRGTRRWGSGLGSLDRGTLRIIGLNWGWTRFQTETVRFADDSIAANTAQLFSDKAGCGTAFPHLGEFFDAFVSPAHAKSVLSIPAHTSQTCNRLGHPIVATL
jgi:hypothetical protein